MQCYQRRCRIKKLIVISTIIIAGFSLLFTAASFTQEKAGTSIFEYKKELSLTDRQEKNLRKILSKLQDYLVVKKKELDVLRAELSKMIVEKADLYRIKAKLRTIARIQADASYEDIASVRAIEKELTLSQMSRWRGMQEEFRKNLQDAQAGTAKATEDVGQQKGVAQ